MLKQAQATSCTGDDHRRHEEHDVPTTRCFHRTFSIQYSLAVTSERHSFRLTSGLQILEFGKTCPFPFFRTPRDKRARDCFDAEEEYQTWGLKQRSIYETLDAMFRDQVNREDLQPRQVGPTTSDVRNSRNISERLLEKEA